MRSGKAAEAKNILLGLSIASARTLVKRARPWLVPSAFVDYYTKQILGN